MRGILSKLLSHLVEPFLKRRLHHLLGWCVDGEYGKLDDLILLSQLLQLRLVLDLRLCIVELKDLAVFGVHLMMMCWLG